MARLREISSAITISYFDLVRSVLNLVKAKEGRYTKVGKGDAKFRITSKGSLRDFLFPILYCCDSRRSAGE